MISHQAVENGTGEYQISISHPIATLTQLVHIDHTIEPSSVVDTCINPDNRPAEHAL